MRVYSEQDGQEFTAWFKSIPGVPTVPTTVHWRLRNVSADKIVQDWVQISPVILADETGLTGVKTVIDVDSQLHTLDDRCSRRENFQLQICADKDLPRQKMKLVDYAIANWGRR